MPENESINIDITGDVTEVTSSMEHALLSVEQVEEATQRLTAQLAQIRTLTENPISLFDQDLATQIDLAERSANRLLDIRRNIDNSMSAESRESNTALLGNMITYTKQRVSDLNASVRQMNELQSAMGDLDASDFNQSMKALYSGLKIGLRQYAEAMSKAIGTQTPNAIIQGFMKTPEYKNVMAKAQSQRGNQHIFNDQNMQKYLASIATVAISPLTNNDYVDWTGQRRTINRVADLLPKQFSNIKLGRAAIPTRDTTSSDFSEKLTKQELNTLQKIILQNQYVAREAEAARLITKHNGSIFMNKDATRGHVNAFAGNIAHLFSLGAMGLPMYGIEDIYDPKHLNSIASKTNKTITNARNMANVLSEQYGEWLDPAYYSTLPDLPQNASSWYRAGQVKASGRKDRMQFLELALDEVGSDGQITFANGEPKYTPVVQSEYQNYLSKQKGATSFTHNGQNENEVFVKLPDEEAIQAVLDKDPAKETAIADEIARVIGTRISHNGKNYSFSGLTKTHAIFTEESIKQEIEKHDPNFFANGESARVFDDYEAFAKAATYNRLQRVEGEDIAELYGVDLGKLNVVVGNFKNLTGLDGQNFISNKLIPEGFQGRSFGGKATYSPFSVEWLFKQYANYVDPKSGNLILPGANVNGGDLVIPPNVDLIEDFSNIKTNKQYNASLSSEELAAIRKQEIADKGLFAKTTYDAAHTNSRFMSAQLVNTMAFTPEAQRYFTGVYMKELAAMQDPSAVIKKLFSGDDLLSQDVRRDITLLNSSEAQRRIQSYVNSLNEHIQKGDVLLPEGEGNYSMISAWLPDVINRTLVTGGKELTSEQEAASLKDDVAYFLREATEVGLARNPATVNGNVEAINKGADEYFKTLAKSIGVDESALYVDPSSVILKRLQGADEDGDTALVYAIKHSTNKVFADVMKATLVNTAEQYKKIRERANLTDEEIEKRAASQTDKVDLGGQQSFSLNNPKDLARFWLEGRKGVLGMGAASAVTRNAFQLGISDRVAKAVLMAEKNYDINSTRDKTARVYLSSADERAMLSEGAPISSIMNWAMKSRTLDENDKMVAFNQEAFNREYAEKIAKSNFTSVNSSTGMQHAIAIWWAKNVEGADVSGGFDWDSIFANLPQEFDKNSAAGQLSARLNDLRKQYIQGDFLVFGEKLEAELKQRSTDTYNEIRNQVNSDKSISERDRNAEIARRYKAAGGEVVGHILQYGLTESNLLKNAEAFADVQSIIDIFGKDNVYGSAVDYDSTYSQKRVDENNKKLEAQRQRKAELELEQQQHADANQQEIAQLKAEIAELKAKDAADKANQLFDGNLIGAIADKEARLESLQNSKRTELDQINAEIAKSESYQRQAFEFYRAQGEYDRIIGGAEEFSRGLWKSQRSKEAYINDIDPATLYYNKQSGIANAYIRQLNHLLEVGGYEKYQTDNIEEQINTIRHGVNVDFMDKSVSNAKHLAESLLARESATSIDYDKSEHELDGYLKKLKEAVDYQSKLLELSQEAKENGRSDDAKNLSEAARQTGEYIASGYQTAEKLRHNLYTQDISGEDKIITRLQRFTRDRNRRYSQSQFERQMLVNENDYEQYEQQYEAIAQRLDIWQARKRGLTASGQVDTESYKLATQEIERLSSALSECQKEMDGLTGASGKVNAGLTVVGQIADRVVTQFAHRVFSQAVNEAQSFVATYDAAMTEIQMVTLKTDEEIAALGDGLIGKAIELKVSVGDVTSAATTLYRQGLDDMQVEERIEDVTKFAKTAKVKTDDAIKLITVSMNSGMVESSKQAMDVISAMSDSAATEAEQITKGLQKSMSAAKEVGVTYQELVSMLTVITSKTQLSGSVAGTTMRNLLSRLVRVNQNDLIVDENGTAISASQQARVLSSLGIQVYDRKDGSIDAFNTLSQVGAMWNELSDAERNQVAFALGGSEQFSNVAALMQGFAETDENGQNLLQKYLEIAENSAGVTDEKYAHYLDGLAASMDGFRASFDAMIESATDSAPIVAFFDFLTSSASGITQLNEATNSLLSTLMLVGGVIAAFITMATPLKAVLAVLGGIMAIGSGIDAIGKAYTPVTSKDIRSANAKAYESSNGEMNRLIEKAIKLNEKQTRGGLSDSEMIEFNQSLFELKNLGHISLDAGDSIDTLARNANKAASALDEAKTSAANYSRAEANRLLFSSMQSIDEDIAKRDKENEEQTQLSAEDVNRIEDAAAQTENENLQYFSLDGLTMKSFDRLYNLANESGYLNNLTVFEEHNDWLGGLLGRESVSIPHVWADLSSKERMSYLMNSDENLMAALLSFMRDPEMMGLYNTSPQGLNDEEMQAMRTSLSTYLPEFANAKMRESVISESIKAMNEEKIANPEGFSAESWVAKNLTDERGQPSETVAAAWLEKRSPQTAQMVKAVDTPFGQIATVADNATMMNKSGSDKISPELYALMTDVEKEKISTGVTYGEMMNELAKRMGEKDYISTYLQNKDNADVAEAIRNAAAIDENGAFTGNVRQEYGRNEWFTLKSLLAEKSGISMGAYRSDAQKRMNAYASLQSVLANENPMAAYNNLSFDTATNRRLQEELGEYVGNELLNVLLSGNAKETTKAYALRKIKYGDEASSSFKDSGYYDVALRALLGEGYKDGLSDEELATAQQNYNAMLNGSAMDAQFLRDILELDGGVDILMELNEALETGETNSEMFAEALRRVVEQMDADELAKMNKYKKNVAELANIHADIAKDGADAVNVLMNLNDETLKLNNVKWAVNQYSKGNASKNVLDIITSNFDIDEATLKHASGDMVKRIADGLKYGIEDEQEQLEDEIGTAAKEMYLSVQGELLDLSGQQIDLGTFADINGRVDVSGLINSIGDGSSKAASAFAGWMQYLAKLGANFIVKGEPGEDGFSFDVDLSGISGNKHYGSSSGGKKKTAGDLLIEKQGYGRDLFDHQVQMVQYEQTKYQNADELGNYGKMLEEEMKIERAYLPVLESNIAALRSELSKVKEGSEDWYKLRDAILEAEEKYADINNTITENENKLEENHQAILKLHTDLEQMVVGEIELRIEAEKEMLSGSVSMQDTILNAIKQRYQDEWDLVKQDIEKKKEALQQEKSLIDERLDARREAEDEAAKYEELAELKKQLALISADSTRTKDAAALRESIAELEKEIGWDIAEKEAENEKNAIQDQIDAYDDYVTKGDEDLDELLSDANNFAEEVNKVLGLSQAELFDWLKQNVKEYANSLDDAQKQMVQSWEATYKQMLGITDTYWDEVNAILSSKDVFLEYMKKSNEYIYASEDERKQLIYQWSEAYDKWMKAQKNDADYNHSDSGLGDWSGSEHIGGSSGSSGSGGSGSSSTQKPSGTTNPDGWSGTQYGDNNYRIQSVGGMGDTITTYNDDLSKAKELAKNYSKQHKNVPVYIYGPDGKLLYQYINGQAIAHGSNAQASGGNGANPNAHWKYKVHQNGSVVKEKDGYTTRAAAQTAASNYIKEKKLQNAKYTTHYYKHGGIADFAGPIWIDGTPSAPERILSANQTRDFESLVAIMDDFRNNGVPMNTLRDMARWSTSIHIPSALSNIGGSAYQGNSSSIGDVIVNITEAQITDDRDVEELANIVGQKFVREIGKQGLNVSHYHF